MFLVADIETAADRELWTPPADAPETFAPIWAHRVVAIGCLLLDDDLGFVKLGAIGARSPNADEYERSLIAGFTSYVDERTPTLVTYNGRGFDVQVLSLRSLRHNLPMAWFHDNSNARQRSNDRYHLDLCDWLSHNGAGRRASLHDIARVIGLPGKIGVDGSQVDAMFVEGKIDEINRYCLSDVAQTAFVFLRYRVLQGRLRQIDYRDRACRLVEALERDGRVADVIEKIDENRLFGEEVPAAS